LELSLPRSAPVVLAHHGTSAEAAAFILREGFQSSQNAYDWLGDGSYFWENNFHRAEAWALQNHTDPVVIEVQLDLENCIDLTDPDWFALLTRSADRILDARKRSGLRPLRQDGLFHGKDRFIINTIAEELHAAGRPLQSVRGAFAEGDPAYPGSAIFSQSHVQIAVRDPAVIRNVAVTRVRRPFP
jgi:hypothetical protein